MATKSKPCKILYTLPYNDERLNIFVPSLVVVDAPHRHHAEVGTSLVVAPGRLSEGDFSIADLRSRKIEAGNVR
ncbi:hypothetical protein [Tepidiphilus sp. J10]|uniref:hypothetical protein n=1 Tax=Tepidiphilus sp. J10 TaxID=2502185 RepID=UPI00115DFBC9|nr:hypothetical protein [Tepidiphilus sp. J10]